MHLNLLISPGLVVNMRSRILFPLVGSLTTCVKSFSFTISISFLFISFPYWGFGFTVFKPQSICCSLRHGWCWGGYLYFLLRWYWWVSLILQFFLIHCLVVCKRLLYVEVGCLRCWFYTIWSHSLLLLLFRLLCSCYLCLLLISYLFYMGFESCLERSHCWQSYCLDGTQYLLWCLVYVFQWGYEDLFFSCRSLAFCSWLSIRILSVSLISIHSSWAAASTVESYHYMYYWSRTNYRQLARYSRTHTNFQAIFCRRQ